MRSGRRLVVRRRKMNANRQPDGDEQSCQRGHLAELTVRDRPVDDVLDHLRYLGGSGEASELRYAEDRHQSDVRPQIRQIAPQRQETQDEKDSLRGPVLGARNHWVAGAD